MLVEGLEHRDWYTGALKNVLKRKLYFLTAADFIQKAMRESLTHLITTFSSASCS